MANYSLVRGWIECGFEDVPRIKEIVQTHWAHAADYGVEGDSADLYLKGWHFPDSPINWTSLVFYGGNVRDVAVSFLKECLVKLCASDLDIDGIFYVDDQEGEHLRIWTLRANALKDEPR